MLSSNPHVEGELFPLKQDLLGFLMMQEEEYISCMLVTFFLCKSRTIFQSRPLGL